MWYVLIYILFWLIYRFLIIFDNGVLAKEESYDQTPFSKNTSSTCSCKSVSQSSAEILDIGRNIAALRGYANVNVVAMTPNSNIFLPTIVIGLMPKLSSPIIMRAGAEITVKLIASLEAIV